MKILKILALSSMLLIVSGCNAQIDKGDKAISMLIDFYTAHANIWSIPPSAISPADFDKKLDSLAGKYCTLKLRMEVKKYIEDGYDLLTDDFGISKESLTTLTVMKDVQENTYVVSYILDSYPESNGKPSGKRVDLHITLVKEGESYKIDSVN